MCAKILDFDQDKRRPRIGNLPAGRILSATAMATVTSIDDLSEAVILLKTYREAINEIFKLNSLIEESGGDPINIDLKKWWCEAYKNTRGYLEIHPSPEELAAFYRGEIEY